MHLRTAEAQRRELLEWTDSAVNGSDTAIFVVHGMGQQKTFETQAQVAESVGKQLEGAGTAAEVTARHVIVDEQRIGRLEMTLTDPAGATRRVDVYEAYWAPLAEGEIGLNDVVSFLFRTGISSLPRFSFRRWMFGGIRVFKTVPGTTIALAVTLLAIASLVAVNGIVAAVIAARVAMQSSGWPGDHLIADLSASAGILGVLLLLFGITVLLALHVKRFGTDAKVEGAVVWTIWIQAGVFFLTLIATVGAMTCAIWHHRETRHASWLLARFGGDFIDRIWWLTMAIGALAVGLAAISGTAKSWWLSKTFVYIAGFTTFVLLGCVVRQLWLNGARPTTVFTEDQAESWLRWMPIWGLLFIVSWFARGFLVQFVGDVAVYVEPHRVDRFNALRENIRKCVFDTADVIYRMKNSAGNGAQYKSIVIVAHSLGSVIAYDTLNALLRRDIANQKKIGVTTRTRALITFGSPLDKIAFLFALQRANDTQEALAATVQPLVDDPQVRPQWINIHSHADIISGALDFYGQCPIHNYVDNKPDPQARIPFAAHVEYWENTLLWSELVKVI